VITEITFRTLSPAPGIVLAFIACPAEAQALDLVATLRSTSHATWRTRQPAGIDVCAIEHMDRRSIEIVREDGAAARHNIAIPQGTELALLVQLEVPVGMHDAAAFEQIQNALSDTGDETGLTRFCRLLDRAGLLAATELALPDNRRRAADFLGVREAVPAGVNSRVAAAKRTTDSRIEKTAADMIVPFERCAEMLEIYRDAFRSRGLDHAIWGHLSDGNVHPNVIPRSYDDVVQGKAAILECGERIAELGGCPLAEHGVGRNPVKQALLRQLYGERGIDEMRAVKRALDPDAKLAPGVIFG
jgi:D-lactate dehydrogenase (cytochrome)